MISKIIFGFIDNTVGNTFITKYHNGLITSNGVANLADIYIKLNTNVVNKVDVTDSDF